MSTEQHIDNLMAKFAAARQISKRADVSSNERSLWNSDIEDAPVAYSRDGIPLHQHRNGLLDFYRLGDMGRNMNLGNPVGGPGTVSVSTGESAPWSTILGNIPGQAATGITLGTGVDKAIGLINHLARGGSFSNYFNPINTSNEALTRDLLALKDYNNRVTFGKSQNSVLNALGFGDSLPPGQINLTGPQAASVIALRNVPGMTPSVAIEVQQLASQGVTTPDLLDYITFKNNFADDPTVNPKTFNDYLIQRQKPGNRDLSYQQSRLGTGGDLLSDPGPAPAPEYGGMPGKPRVVTNQAAIDSWNASNAKYQAQQNALASQLAAERAMTAPLQQQLATGKLPQGPGRVRIDRGVDAAKTPEAAKASPGFWNSMGRFVKRIAGKNPEFELGRSPFRNRFIGQRGAAIPAILGMAYPFIDHLIFRGPGDRVHAREIHGNLPQITPMVPPNFPPGVNPTAKPYSDIKNDRRPPELRKPSLWDRTFGTF
jgi:hypothetical protein